MVFRPRQSIGVVPWWRGWDPRWQCCRGKSLSIGFFRPPFFSLGTGRLILEEESALANQQTNQAWLDNTRLSVKTRGRYAFWFFTIASGAWWIWATVLVSRFRVTQPTYDWATPGFVGAFAVYILLNAAFQVNYLYL